MELGLSLGDASKPFGFMEKPNRNIVNNNNNNKSSLGFCMALSIGSGDGGKPEQQQQQKKDQKKITDSDDDDDDEDEDEDEDDEEERERVVSLDHPHPVQLNLLPLAPVPLNHLSSPPPPPPPPSHASPWNGHIGLMTRGFDVNRIPAASASAEDDAEEGGAAMSSSPSRNSGASSFQMDLCMYSGGGGGSGNKRDSNELLGEGENGERASSRASDDDENGSTRKKLRLSKDQSAFLEESFKEHNTLNPQKQKLALAKQLNLRPRQVEVWFQNRRARTKLKQTEVDCEYLKRCCETLTEENRRLHKELQELRALKSSNSNPFFMQLPATTLTMCPSCERVATTTATTATCNNTSNHPLNTATTSKQTPFSLSRPRLYPFSHSQQDTTHQPNQSKAS